MNLFAKRALKSTAAALSPFLNRKPHPCSLTILAYHRVVADIEKAEREAIYGIVISSETFRKHCELLKHSFSVIPLDEAVSEMSRDRSTGKPLAAITFDDGYRDFYECAFPILKSFGLPATMFLPTSYIGQRDVLEHDKIFWLVKHALESSTEIKPTLLRFGLSPDPAKDILGLTDHLVHLPRSVRRLLIAELESVVKPPPYPDEYGLLNWEQIKEMDDCGINFGSHSLNHAVLTEESDETAVDETVNSKSELEERLGKVVSSFAYPNGRFNDRIQRKVGESGYQIAVTTEARINHRGANPLELGRISLCEESTRGVRGRFSPRIAALRLGA